MISFNTKDFNLSQIRIESKLFNLKTQNTYRIYGLRQENNPPVLLSYTDSADEVIINMLSDFFYNNNIDVELDANEKLDEDFRIGIRKDVRKHVILASSIIQTIIYTIENKLNLKTSYKIPGIPKF